MNPRPHFFVIAGEPSGDMIGSLLIAELLRINPDARVSAIGGDQMQRVGADVRFNIVRDLAIIGVTEVVLKYPQIRRLFNETKHFLRTERPDVLVVIDYPGFNLRIAEFARNLGIKVVYYVIPQIWAWHRSRVKKIRKFVNRAVPILPFEEDFLRNEGVEAQYVGHPLLDIMKLTMNREEVFDHFGLDPAKKLITLLPGSRRKEVESLLPDMLDAAGLIAREEPAVQFVLPMAASLDREFVDGLLQRSPVEVKVVDAFRYNVRAAADFAIVTSGTATLETGLLGVPQVIVYRVAPITWHLGRLVVDVPFLGLINLVAGERIADELLQDECTPQNIAERALAVLRDPAEIARTKEKLAKVREKLGGGGASRRVAEVVYEVYASEEPRPAAAHLAPGH